MRTGVRRIAMLGVLAGCAAVAGAGGTAMAATEWVEGTHYFAIQPAQPTAVGPGQVEVTEVFSYACPACNAFYRDADQLRQSLPKNAVMDYVSAGFIPSEDWPMFQRAYYTVMELGIWNQRVHDQMFDAVWKTGELATMEPNSERIKTPAPRIEDAARFYARTTGVSAAKFVATAHSFAVDAKVRQADQYIEDCGVDSTPTIIVNGKYRVTPSSAGGYNTMIEVVDWLVKRELHH